MQSQHIIIVGGGLAGPTLGLALSRLVTSSSSATATASTTFKCTILERRPKVESKGGVIMLAPNAMRVMQMVGLEKSLRDISHPIDAIHIHTDSRPIGGFKVSESGVRGLSLARPDLHQILVDECRKVEGISVRHDAKVAKIEEGEHGATVFLESGEKVEGDVVIGCDGIGSRVREHILGDRNPPPVYSGFVVVGSLPSSSSIKMPSTVKLPAFMYTQHGTFLSFGMDGANERMAWATMPRVEERDRKTGWDEYRNSGQAVKDLKEAHKHFIDEPIRSWIDNLSNENVWTWAPYTLPELPTWHSKRTCILGDAAHAFPPSIGQGTAQAFEDVGYLARLIVSAGANAKAAEVGKIDYEQVFEQFERTRRQRVDKVRQMAIGGERFRGKTSWPVWWLKSNLMWGVFKLIGNKGYMEGDFLNGYDVTRETLPRGWETTSVVG